MAIGRKLVPMLDGVVLTRHRGGFQWPDGRDVDAQRRPEITFVSLTRERPRLIDEEQVELVDALRAIGLDAAQERADVEDVDAGFFHRTLARWLGLPEGRARGDANGAAAWSYDVWRADLVDETPAAAPTSPASTRRQWRADVYRTADATPECYRYWLDVDDTGRIIDAAWLGAAPRLLELEAARKDDDVAALPALAPDVLEALYRDDP